MPHSWQQVERLFNEALERPASERKAFLESVCGSDHDLLREVESLLRHEGAPTGRLANPLQPVAADLLSAAHPTSEPPLSMFGPYKVDRKLGHGGMGAVYLATDTRLGRRVAIKVAGGLRHTAEARSRFLREAQSAAALAHPNIAVIHDFGETEGQLWLVMEYIAGASLRLTIKSGPADENVWMDYATQIASALEHAHARRIIHRDVKPENIMLSDEGVIKLVDFGTARLVNDAGGDENRIESGMFAGTLAYTAPELFEGEEATTRADVYSFGVTLWELAHGSHPFAGMNGRELVRNVLAGQRSAPVSGVSISPVVQAFLERCLSRVAPERYADGQALSAALRAIRTGGLIEPLPVRSSSIAVLDFANLSGHAEADWLGTGIAESLCVDLAQLKTITVANRGRVQESVRRAGHPHSDRLAAAELGRSLGVTWILTGSFQQIGDRVRLAWHLVETSKAEVLAVAKIDGPRDEFFDLQDRLAAAVMQHVRSGLGTDFTAATPAVKPPSLLAYEHYMRGRQQMYQMEGRALNTAIEHFNEAVALDPEYALAYSALGTAHMLRFPKTSDPGDVVRASECLERAVKLDPELGEPYPWLNNIRIRQNNPEGAFAAGRKAIELQPDLPEAHYFYGGGQYMLAEHPKADPNEGLKSLTRVLQLQPKFHPAWIGAGALSIFVGRYDSALQLLAEAIRMEQEPDLIYRFEGAHTLSGIAWMRLGNYPKASDCHKEALDKLSNSDHVYSDTFRILSACGLGDIDLRTANAASALGHFRRAWQIVKEKPRVLGSLRLQIRAGAGLASAYAQLGEPDRARELIRESYQRIEEVQQPATATFECGLAQLHLDLGVAELQLDHPEASRQLLLRALEKGWRDFSWLRADPMWRPLHGDPVLLSLGS